MLFTKEEYKQRLSKVQKMMQEKGIELLISHDTNNINYLTGYDAWSFYYAQCAVVHINADEPICFVRDQDAGGAYIKTYLKKENIIVYDEHYIHTWPKHPYDYLVKVIKEKKWDKLSIGLEMDAHYFTAFCYEKIKNGLNKFILSVSVNGYGKRTSYLDFRVTNRGGKGIIGIINSSRNGDIASSLVVGEEDEIILSTDKGSIMRCAVKEIRIAGRNTQGVRIKKLKGEEKVVSVIKIDDNIQ